MIRGEFFGTVYVILEIKEIVNKRRLMGSRYPDYAILGCRRMTTVWNDLNRKYNNTLKVECDSF